MRNMPKTKRCKREERTFTKNKNMKKISIIAAAILILAACGGERVSKDAKVSDGLDSFSYAQGILTASFLKNQGISEVNFDAFYRGLNEGLEKDTGFLIKADGINVFAQNYVRQQQTIKIQAIHKGANDYMKGLKDKGYQSLPNGAYYKILSRGNGPNAKAYDTVEMSLTIKNIAGEEMFNSFEAAGGKRDMVPLTMLKLGPLEDALEIIPGGSKFELVMRTDSYPFLGQFSKGKFDNKYGISHCTFDVAAVIPGKEVKTPPAPALPQALQ